jgi:phosphoadenosine phosphosulfate reductase
MNDKAHDTMTPMMMTQTPLLAEAPAWTPESLKPISAQFEGRAPQDVLLWGIEHFAPEVALATGFGPEGIVLMHLLSQIAPETTVFYLDTDLLFAETYALRDELEARLGLRFTRVRSGLSPEAQAEQYGPLLWSYEPSLCCHLRKVEPLRRFLATQRAWITAIRRDQTPARANAGLVEWDRANGLVKLNPLAAWTSEQVWDHIHAHQLPFNPLHSFGYPSIGCWPCTRPVTDSDDPRAGRWAGFSKTECGIHLPAKA